MKTPVPANLGFLGLNVSVIDLFKDLAPSNVLNTVLSSIITLDKFAGYDVQSVKVSNAVWGGDVTMTTGDVTLWYQLTIVSDPLSTADILIIIGLILALIGTGLLVALSAGALSPVWIAEFGIVTSYLGAAGLFGAAGVSAVQSGGGVGGIIAGSSNSTLGTAALIIGLGVVGVLGYMYLKEPKRRAQAHRYVGRAKSAAKSAYKTVTR